MSHTLDKPRLPGIQFLLSSPEDREKKHIVVDPPTTSSSRPVMGHRSTRSVSSLPSDLQKLSLYPSSKDDSDVVQQGTAEQPPPHLPSLPFTHSVKPPFTSNATASWNTPPSTTACTTPISSHHPNHHRHHLHTVPAVLLPPLPTTDDQHHLHHTLQPPPLHSRRNGHGRSLSEYTLPPHPLAPRHMLPFDTATAVTTAQTESSTAAITGGRGGKGGGGGGPARTHRRAVSANTVDFMLRSPTHIPPTPSSSTSSSSSSNGMIRAQSDSPPERRLRSPPPPPSLSLLQDATIDDQTHQQLQRDATSGRYLCPFCNKGFSRPSSLRIHTYSHTGEKPYVCSEEGCGRRFSVQSNMRRHLRVHRMGRQAMKSSPLRKS